MEDEETSRDQNLPPATLKVLDTLRVSFGNPRQGSDVLAVLVREFLEFMDIPKGEFQIHRQRFDSFVYRHSVTFSVAELPPEETSLDGDLEAAKLRLLWFAEIAASELDARQLNALSINMSGYAPRAAIFTGPSVQPASDRASRPVAI